MSYMDFYEFLAVIMALGAGVFIVNKLISLADARARIELQKRMQKMVPRTSSDQIKPGKKNSQQQAEDIVEVGKWVYDLADAFGWDPDQLFQEEMPEDVKRLLPLAKGFVDSGGLTKLLAGAGSGPENQAGAPPVMTGPGWGH